MGDTAVENYYCFWLELPIEKSLEINIDYSEVDSKCYKEIIAGDNFYS